MRGNFWGYKSVYTPSIYTPSLSTPLDRADHSKHGAAVSPTLTSDLRDVAPSCEDVTAASEDRQRWRQRADQCITDVR